MHKPQHGTEGQPGSGRPKRTPQYGTEGQGSGSVKKSKKPRHGTEGQPKSSNSRRGTKSTNAYRSGV